MINLIKLNKETLVDIVLDLDQEVSYLYNIYIPQLEERIQFLSEEIEEMNKKRKYWKDKALKNMRNTLKVERKPNEEVERKVPQISIGEHIVPITLIRRAQGNTWSNRDSNGVPRAPKRKKDDLPKNQRKREHKDRGPSQGGNWLRSQHIYHKTDDVGYKAEFTKNLKNKKGEIVINEGDVYEFDNLRAVEEFYIGKGLKKATWRANNLSTAIIRRGGYMDGAIWEYIKIKEEE